MVPHRRASLLLQHSPRQSKGGGDALLLTLAGFAFASCLLLLLPSSPAFSAAMDDLLQQLGRTRCDQESTPPACCSAVANGTICCDRTALRTDVCVMRGDVRTQPGSNSLFLLLPANSSSARADERIRPYTRKWEFSVMSTIDELCLRATTEAPEAAARCDVRHNVPSVVFSTGGYTGKVYHEFYSRCRRRLELLPAPRGVAVGGWGACCRR